MRCSDRGFRAARSGRSGVQGFCIELWRLGLQSWEFRISLQHTFKKQQEMGLHQAGDLEQMKRIFIEANPYYLVG